MRNIPVFLLLASIITFGADLTEAPPLYYEAPPAREMTLDESIEYYQEQCSAGDEQSCFDLIPRLHESCIDRNYDSCFSLALAYGNGTGVRQDRARAFKIDERSCNANHAMSCYNLAVSYYNGEGVRQNKSKAKEFYGKSCDLKDQRGCDTYVRMNKQGIK